MMHEINIITFHLLLPVSVTFISIYFSFGRLSISPFRSTLTELCLGYWINCEHFRYFGQLHNLRVLCLDISLDIVDDDIMHIKVSILLCLTFMLSEVTECGTDGLTLH